MRFPSKSSTAASSTAASSTDRSPVAWVFEPGSAQVVAREQWVYQPPPEAIAARRILVKPNLGYPQGPPVPVSLGVLGQGSRMSP